MLCVGNVGWRIMEIDVDEGEKWWRWMEGGFNDEEHGWRVRTWSLGGMQFFENGVCYFVCSADEELWT